MKVLIVDDERPIREILAMMLEEICLVVIEADSLSTGTAVYLKHQDDLVCAIVDHKLLDGSGLKLVETIRERDSNMRLMVISGHTDLGRQAVEAGADIFVSKPFIPPDISAPPREWGHCA